MTYLKLGSSIIALLAVTAILWASESDEIRENAKAMQREAARLAEQGHREEAAKLDRRAMAMLQEAERLQQRRPKHREAGTIEMERLLEKLQSEERELERIGGRRERLEVLRREVVQVKKALWERLHPRRGERGSRQDDTARRLEHMRIAVEHLNHAGLHEVAEQVAHRAEAAEKELHERRPRRGDEIHEIMRQLEELRREVGKLRDEVNEIREKR